MELISILVLGVLIFVHELGHFLVAKYFKIGVVEFAIGFGPKVFSVIRGETRYSLRAIPLGGFVRMVGDTPDQLLGEVHKEDPTLEEHEKALLMDRSKWFLLKPLFPRASVVFAGPLFNFIFAFLVSFICISMYGAAVENDHPIVGELVEGYPAEKAGIHVGDKILTINGHNIVKWRQISETIATIADGPIVMEVLRPAEKGDEHLTFDLRSKENGAEVDYLLGTGQGKKTFMVGLRQKVETKPVSFGQAIVSSAMHVGALTYMNVKSIQGLIVGIISPKQLGGPLSIFKEVAKSANKGLEALLEVVIFLSVSLAVLNLLPIPVLDGGHLFFYFLELLKGKPVSFRAQEYATRFGMAFLFLLMLYAFRNDIHNIFLS